MTAFWIALPPWARQALMFLGAAICVFLFGKAYLASRDARVRADQNRRNDIKNMQADEKTADTIRNLEKASEDEVREAVAARDAVVRGVPAGELPRDVQERIFLEGADPDRGG